MRKWRGPNFFCRIIALLLGLNLLLAGCGPGNAPTPSPTPGFTIADASKIDTLLRDLVSQYQLGGLEAARAYAQERGLLDEQDRVRFSLTLTGPQAVAGVTTKLQQMGGEIYQTYGNQLAVAVSLPKLTGYIGSVDKRDFFTELAALKEVRELRVLLKPGLDWSGLTTEQTGSNLSPATLQARLAALNEGVAAIGADKWQSAGFRGRGVKVGIIDGGFRGYRAGLGTFLPPASQITLRSFTLNKDEGSETHGVAVAEVVHSLAPEANLLFAPIEDELGFAQAVDWLIENKVQVIQISLGWAGLFPGDGTGKMDEQLDKARRNGILPVVSVGNYGRSHFAARLSPDQNGYHRFGEDGRTTLKLTAEATSAWVSLRWEEKWDQPASNLDLFVLDTNLKPVASSRNEQGNGSPKPPTELAPFKTSPGQTFYLQVRLAGKPAATLPKFHLFAYNATLQDSMAEGSVATPGDAKSIISVGAVNWRDNRLEEYSSRGPTVDGRPKPELTGPSRVTTQALGPERSFTGTSAAAPQVSGTAALLWSAAPVLNADQIGQYLSRNAFRPGNAPPARDPATGFGRVQLGPVEAAQRGPIELLSALPAGPAFQDNFKALDSGLPDNSLGYYGKLPEGLNAYFIQAGESGELSWSTYLQKNFEEFRADFEVAPLQPDPAIFYGLTFWQQGPQDYYAFVVSGDRYALLRRKETGWETLVDWSRSEALNPKPGPTTRQLLSVEATASYIRLRAGDKILQGILLKEARPGGRLGFTAGLFNQGRPLTGGNPAYAMFSNLVVTPLSSR